jgi:lipopolysaccharide export system protein LptC
VESETLIAETKEDVTLEFGDRVVYASGMEANFETNNLKLLADVNGTFLP